MSLFAPLNALPYQAFGQHPYVSHRSVFDPYGRLLLQTHCRACGDTWEKVCQHPERLGFWIGQYALQHAHGLRPIVR